MKIEELPVKQRKVILWMVVAALGAVLFFWWGKNIAEIFNAASYPKVSKELKESLQGIQEEFTFSVFEEIEIPEEVFKELKEYGRRQGQ